MSSTPGAPPKLWPAALTALLGFVAFGITLYWVIENGLRAPYVVALPLAALPAGFGSAMLFLYARERRRGRTR